MEYYILVHGEAEGPFQSSELPRRRLSSRKLVWRDGLAGWTAAGELAELTDLLSKRGPPPPPPPVVNAARTAVLPGYGGSPQRATPSGDSGRRGMLIGIGIAFLTTLAALNKGCRMFNGVRQDFGPQRRPNGR